MGFHVRCAGTRADAARFVFDQKFADKRLAKAKQKGLAINLELLNTQANRHVL